MASKRVAGTIMLHLEDGSKKFLVHSIDDKLEFALAELSEGKTGLANILNFLKEIVHIDVSKISLMELTNTHINQENVPLFVFETEQKNQREEIRRRIYLGRTRSNALCSWNLRSRGSAFLLKYRLSEQRSLNFFQTSFFIV